MQSPAWLNRASVGDGCLWLFIQVGVGLLPLWGLAAIFFLVGRKYEMYDLLKNGEFVLYAASFVTGGLYSVRHDIFPFRKSIQVVLVIIVVLATVVFASISVVNIGEKPSWLRIDQTALTTISYGVFAVSTLLCFGIAIAEAGNAGFNIPEKLRKDRKALETGLDKLLSGG